MVCPKCGYKEASGDECGECGVIFAKFYAYQERKRERAQKKEDQAAQGEEDILDHYFGAVEPTKPVGGPVTGGPVNRLLQQYFWQPYNTPWKPVHAWQMIALSVFFAFFLYGLVKDPWYSLYPDVTKTMDSGVIRLFKRVNLVFHEGGHAIFKILGIRSLHILGGSLNQVLIPFIVCIAFWRRREATGFGFAMVWMFQNFLEVGIYMADARKPVLPLLSGSGSFDGGHDWLNLFNMWDLWSYDTLIAKTTWTLGWIGMVGTICWYGWIWLATRSRAKDEKDDFVTGR